METGKSGSFRIISDVTTTMRNGRRFQWIGPKLLAFRDRPFTTILLIARRAERFFSSAGPQRKLEEKLNQTNGGSLAR